ncbi:hypothetical protein K435DRAFT_867793 [Dendrothele bispora CBS 962.96]|uniref:Uncharacterized protein n=1 Tax=Dendrothele bispora (strain CBS 962.96) TaxID=1314807 RepID=A0A4S8LDE0_DENBC|nr:hypothetical protein K435DRAFT_867793 [Dendrothele bispora CBS 962.96]
MDSWSTVLSERLTVDEVENSVASNFQEASTRDAIRSVSHQLCDFGEKLDILQRQTEPFSPSKRGSSGFMVPPFSTNSTLGLAPAPQFPVFPKFSIASTSSTSFSSRLNASTGGTTNIPISVSPPFNSHFDNDVEMTDVSQEPPSPALVIGLTSGHTLNPILPNQLIPYISALSEHHSFNVLPLVPQVPGQEQVHTPHNMILPAPSAFFKETAGVDCSQYPIFQSQAGAFTWTNLLDMIKNPVKVWDVYKPLGLGEYPDIQSLWGVWEEGRRIDGIGRSVPL